MNRENEKAMFAKNKRKCDFNFGCEDYAIDGSSKRWHYRTENNAKAKHNVRYRNNDNPETEHDADVCDGCLLSIDDPDMNMIEEIRENLYEPRTKSYQGKRGKKGESVVIQPQYNHEMKKSLKRMKRYSALTEKQKNDEWIKHIVPKLRKANMKEYGRYIIDVNGNYIGDKELRERYES